VGVDRKRLLDVAARFLVPAELIGQEITERIQERGVAGLLCDERLEHPDRFTHAALLLVEQRLGVAYARVALVLREAFVEQRLGALERAALGGVLREDDVELSV